MNRMLVHSTVIGAISYEPTTQILEVEFNNGTTYQYYNVDTRLYEELMAAPSKGKFFDHRIRDQFQFVKI